MFLVNCYMLFNLALIFLSQFKPGHAVEPGMEIGIMNFDQSLGEKLNAKFWQGEGLKTLRVRLSNLQKAGFPSPNKNRPVKNIIFFIGDGLGLTGVTATRKFKELFSNQPFYRNELVWDSFPFTGLAKTYELDNVIADSAGTATAYLTGVKTRMGFIGLDASADMTCRTAKGRLESIASRAAKIDKVTGFVTTTTITHASPSPLYANLPAPLRSYEYSSDKFEFSKSHPACEDIAKQFVKNAKHIKVALGGGRGYFTPNNETSKGDYKKGSRNDGRNLINEWLDDRSEGGSKRAQYVSSKEDLLALDPKRVDYLLGLFHYSHMTFVDDDPPSNEPSLSEMTSAAIRVLQENENGYFLFVEGGRIDHGHHSGIARYALREGIEFDKAIQTALDMTDLSETLIVVSADHSHTLTMGGYLSHSSNVLDPSVNIGYDKRTFTSLMYANGPGANRTGPEAPYSGYRRNDSESNTRLRGYLQQSTVPLRMESHGGEDVPVYATGLYSELFSGVFEQNYIPWAMACAAGIHHGPEGNSVKELETLCPRPYHRSTMRSKVYLPDNSNSSPLISSDLKSDILMLTFLGFVKTVN